MTIRHTIQQPNFDSVIEPARPPLLRRAAKIRGGQRRLHRRGWLCFNDHHKGSPTLKRQDKQMPNTALALTDTVTEPKTAVER